MSSAASFAERWARDNLYREASPEELKVLALFLSYYEGNEEEAAKRARKYYMARGPRGSSALWHNRHPDDEDILCSCQDAYIIPLRVRSVGGRLMTLVRLPAPTALDRPLNAKALLARWLMICDIRLKEDPIPVEEVIVIDVSDLQPPHLKNHFKGTYWRDFVHFMKTCFPLRSSEIHVMNTKRLKAISWLLLHIGLSPLSSWRRRVLKVHAAADQINHVMGLDYYPPEGLPYEYGGNAGAMKDLNDEWTKKILHNSKWLQLEERKFYETELKPDPSNGNQHLKNVRCNNSYNVLPRTQSCRSLHRHHDIDEAIYGEYRTLKLRSAKDFYV